MLVEPTPICDPNFDNFNAIPIRFSFLDSSTLRGLPRYRPLPWVSEPDLMTFPSDASPGLSRSCDQARNLTSLRGRLVTFFCFFLQNYCSCIYSTRARSPVTRPARLTNDRRSLIKYQRSQKNFARSTYFLILSIKKSCSNSATTQNFQKG